MLLNRRWPHQSMILSAALALCASGVAGAETTDTGRVDVRIAVAYSRFDPASEESIERSISAQLSGMNVDVIYHRLDDIPTVVDGQMATARELMAADSAIAAFVIYPSSPYVIVRTVFATANGILTDTRTVDTADRTPLHEALGIIVRAATEAVMERPTGRLPTARTPEPRSSPKVEESETAAPPPPRSAALRRLYFGLGAAVGLYSKGVPPWIGLDLELGLHATRDIYLLFGYAALSKVRKSAYEVDLTLRRNPFRFGLGFSRPLRRVVLGGSVMFEVDYVIETVSTRNTEAILNADSSEVHWAVVGRLHLDVAVAGPLAFFLNVEAEIPLAYTEYLVSLQDEGQTVFLNLLPIQPVLRSGFKVHFF